jgi:hypothetical protein
MDSLADGSYTDSSDSYASCVYVGGKGQNGEQDIYEGEIDSATGLDRFEVFDNKTELTTEAEYKAEAESMLLQYNKNISISGNGLAHCPYEYGKQYNVGDYINVSFSGHSAKVQILSVTQSWQYGQYGLQFEYGKPLATLDGQLQAIMRKVQEGNKPRTTDSVMWYTLPQDTAQSKDEIKYDTIGFMGSTATQSTFTLYLDEEKNGAKTYHVYLKELNGNSLTLTTGRTGAKDLTISTGTYVLIIYVDENGNINEQGTTATDVVVQGNTQPVTSDAVATAIQQCSVDLGPDYANGVTTQLSTTQGGTSTGALTTTFTATEDCYIVARHYTLNAGGVDVTTSLLIYYGTDTTFGTEIYRTQLPGVYGAGVACTPIRLTAGETITIVYKGYNNTGYCKNYTVYPVKRGN